MPWWLPAAIIGGWLLVGHGCHGPDEDHELCVPWVKSAQEDKSPGP